MNHPAHHIIHQETFEISGNRYPSMQKLESEANRIAISVFQPEIEYCLNSIPIGHEHLVIKRIEIDLGVLTASEFENEVGLRLRAKLTAALSKYARHHTHSTSLWAQRLEESFDLVRENEEAEVGSVLKAFLFYIEHGHLPWWWEQDPHVFAYWHQEIKETDIPSILQVLNDAPTSIPRLVGALSDEMLGKLCASSGLGKSVWQGWNEIKKYLHVQRKELISCRNVFWEYCLSQSNHTPTGINQDLVIQKIASHSSLKQEELKFFLTTVFGNPKSESFVFLDSILSQTNERKITGQRHVESLSNGNGHSGNGNGKPIERKVQEDLFLNEKKITEPHPEQTRHKKKADENILQIIHAGTILTHPFLGELFQSRNWLEKNAFIETRTSALAVRMIGYLASGDPNLPETDLLLAKLLCGLEWEEPVSFYAQLTDEDLVIGDELLAAIIKHWAAIGNTSPDGLRSGFFHRNGVLTPKDNGWLLRVEQQAQDILLNRLPWGFSTIRLPWMKNTLHVSWI